MEGMTYEEIRQCYPEEYKSRKRDKLHYRYPGAGGEGYLDIINRLRPIIVEIERLTDHVLIISHRSVARVLLAYFKGLKREDVAELDVPIGMLYMLEPVSLSRPSRQGGGALTLDMIETLWRGFQGISLQRRD
jgi:6-phosphofructo-2-kinase